MSNLIKNGEFILGDTHWKIMNDRQVCVVDGECRITPPGSISQEIDNIEAGAEYALAARMKSASGLIAHVILKPQPTGEELCLSLADADNWQVVTDWAIMPPGTTGASVTLVTEGKTTVAWSHFGSLELVRLDQIKPTHWVARLIAWIRSTLRS